jgi:hypothetical protein
MNEAEFKAWCDRVDETPTYRLGGRILGFEDASEYRARARRSRRPRGDPLMRRRLQLDEFEARMRRLDRMLDEL